MANQQIAMRSLTVTDLSSFSIDFDILVGEERIRSIAGGGAIDDYNYLMVSDPTGEARGFDFDFSPLKKTISPTSLINIVIRLTDIDGHVQEWGFSKNYAVEAGYSHVSNLRISQRRDGSGLIDIEYDYASPREVSPATVYIFLSSDGGKTWTVPTTSMVGDVGVGVAVGPNRKATWNPSEDFLESQPFRLNAKVSLTSSFGDQVAGQTTTGTIIVSPVEHVTPVISLSTSPSSSRYAIRDGNICKVLPVEFEPIESSSSSSE